MDLGPEFPFGHIVGGFLSGSLRRPAALLPGKYSYCWTKAHDTLDTRVALAGRRNISYIINWNARRGDRLEWTARIFKEGDVTTPRDGKRVVLLTVHTPQIHEGKTYIFKRMIRAAECTIDRYGQRLLAPEIEVEVWWTTFDLQKP